MVDAMWEPDTLERYEPIYLFIVSCSCFMQVSKGEDLGENKGVYFLRPKV